MEQALARYDAINIYGLSVVIVLLFHDARSLWPSLSCFCRTGHRQFPEKPVQATDIKELEANNVQNSKNNT